MRLLLKYEDESKEEIVIPSGSGVFLRYSAPPSQLSLRAEK